MEIPEENKQTGSVQNEIDQKDIVVQNAKAEKRQAADSDNDNGFVTAATEDSSNKGQGPAGEDL